MGESHRVFLCPIDIIDLYLYTMFIPIEGITMLVQSGYKLYRYLTDIPEDQIGNRVKPSSVQTESWYGEVIGNVVGLALIITFGYMIYRFFSII